MLKIRFASGRECQDRVRKSGPKAACSTCGSSLYALEWRGHFFAGIPISRLQREESAVAPLLPLLWDAGAYTGISRRLKNRILAGDNPTTEFAPLCLLFEPEHPPPGFIRHVVVAGRLEQICRGFAALDIFDLKCGFTKPWIGALAHDYHV